MKTPDNDLPSLYPDQSSPNYTGQRTGAHGNRLFNKAVKWQGPGLVLLTCVVIGITFSQWQRLAAAMLAGDYRNAQPVFIYAFIGLELTIALSAMTAMLIRANGLLFLITIIYAALPFATSPQSDLKIYFIAASALLISSASFSIRSEAELLVKPSIWRYFKTGASRYFTAASLAAAFCVGVSFNSSFTTVERLVPAKVFNFYMEEMHRYLPQDFTLPSDISNNNVDAKSGIVIALPQTNEDINGYLERDARQTMNRAMAKAVAEADINATQGMVITAVDINSTVALMRSELSEQIGVELTGNEQALTVLYKLFILKTNALITAYSEPMPIIAGVAAFALMRGLGMIAYYPALILTHILMAIGQALKLWRLEKETVTLERFRI